ncbi:methyl-accepting chemotaxis protein [Methyloversatilis sp.]|uniref:methyl-accepting chemotaxis protein n=1 Tax=Methyloversatilis sp. TaxID=2569862 RepID=UPI0027323612|nr:PAS domain-containing methyl-accepting chemotaxis protein [Methyloversatilis sp.]MDP2869899.1 PAS domain-containing methyl-accepting chemotaxis protein [Methyloversatilis sp.]MDP3288764.1 PAS domain-containing methyl-accepting chemotaxis protein [Methyloversatilis sp.]MDP3457466.1 PAS domain-containing methyl-accepting chemotaxis protein [Methyloversatilis sp.]MDP3578819.1 PAS domain-containing methyl-accepting chemotaxis protein [Methyloversatilis sp.]
MRINQPVTTAETLLPEGMFIYSRTDLAGNLVEANEAFASISAFTRDAMLGQPHNMVRHPDMPPEAFADMWRDLKAGRPWRGIVKNRRSDGGYYWVVANSSPVRENGQVIGYQSVRLRPTREEVAAADGAYRRLREGDALISVKHGRIVPKRKSPLAHYLDFRNQSLLMSVLLLLLSAASVAGMLVEFPARTIVIESLACLGFAQGLFYALFAGPRMNRDMTSMADHLEAIMKSGNLKLRSDPKREDRIGDVGRTIDDLVAWVQATLLGMQDSAKLVRESVVEVSGDIASVENSARVQSDASAAAASGIEQITVSIGEVANHAAATRDSASLATRLSAKGAELSEQTSQTISTLSESVKAAAQQVEMLGSRAEDISRITLVIKDIADQTNLLALNAAIEAARAGEQGRGFAVVADEVRKLAERTAQATQEIAAMTQSIQSETGKAVDSMRSGAMQVDASVVLVREVRSALGEISQQMENTSHMVNDISCSTHEQQQAMTQMAQNVEQVSVMTEQNMAAVGQSNATVARLGDTMERMRKSVSQFVT